MNVYVCFEHMYINVNINVCIKMILHIFYSLNPAEACIHLNFVGGGEDYFNIIHDNNKYVTGLLSLKQFIKFNSLLYFFNACKNFYF